MSASITRYEPTSAVGADQAVWRDQRQVQSDVDRRCRRGNREVELGPANPADHDDEHEEECIKRHAGGDERHRLVGLEELRSRRARATQRASSESASTRTEASRRK